MIRVRVTYADGHVDYVPLPSIVFGVEGVEAHGPVTAYTIAGHDDEPELPREMRKSLRLAEVPIYGTGRNR